MSLASLIKTEHTQAISIHRHMARTLVHTPADQDVPPEVFPLGEEGNGQQSVKVDALHQQPEVTRHDAILEENHHRLAAHLQESTDRSG